MHPGCFEHSKSRWLEFRDLWLSGIDISSNGLAPMGSLAWVAGSCEAVFENGQTNTHSGDVNQQISHVQPQESCKKYDSITGPCDEIVSSFAIVMLGTGVERYTLFVFLLSL